VLLALFVNSAKIGLPETDCRHTVKDAANRVTLGGIKKTEIHTLRKRGPKIITAIITTPTTGKTPWIDTAFMSGIVTIVIQPLENERRRTDRTGEHNKEMERQTARY
jgi:hypothetical protein